MSPRNKEKVSLAKAYSYGLVTSQLTLIAAIIWKAKWSYIEVPFTILGLFLGIWSAWHLRRQLSALPEPIQGKKLIRSGPYRIVRHPIYFAILIWGLGKLFSSFDVGLLILYLLLFGVLFFKIRHEEKLLLNCYSDYKEYKSKTAGLIPFLI